MSSFRVPFALDAGGKLFSPEEAEKGNGYFCPSCKDALILRKGHIKAAHFSHKVTDACNKETILHKTAKILIHKSISDWKSGKANSPIIIRKCDICGVQVEQSLPSKVDSAALEQRTETGHIVDVMLLSGGVHQAAIEIKVTHAVDDVKAGILSIPFIELNGNDVLENPFLWKPTLDRFNALVCNDCKSRHLMFKDFAYKVAKKTNIELPEFYYRYAVSKCWSCKRYIIVFAWPDGGPFSLKAPIVEPVPRTIQYRYSKTFRGKYWCNVCHYCNSIQGDNFLFQEPGGEFFGLNIRGDTPKGWRRDMFLIAYYSRR